MQMKVTIECDKCIADIEIEATHKTFQNRDPYFWNKVRKAMDQAGWHHGRDCLCQECKESVGSKNCMACVHAGYLDHEWRCKRPIYENRGLIEIDYGVVSKYDICDHYEYQERLV